MTTENTTEVVPAWGEANERRGNNPEAIAAAIAFVARFPIGSTLSPEDFDAWAHERGLLNNPGPVKKTSDVWKAHLQRRHEVRHKIHRAANHPRMREHGSQPFVIEATQFGKAWEVRAPEVAITRHNLAHKLETLAHTKRRQLACLMQSADWTQLPPYERLVAETLYDDITAFEDNVSTNAQFLTSKFLKLEARIRHAVEAGEIQPRNGGILVLLESSALEEEQE